MLHYYNIDTHKVSVKHNVYKLQHNLQRYEVKPQVSLGQCFELLPS
jgi:hypothetical protein